MITDELIKLNSALLKREWVISAIEAFSDEELIKELERRGYTGKIKKTKPKKIIMDV